MEKFRLISEQIEELFRDRDKFAKISANIDIDLYEAKQFDFYEYPLGLDWIGIRKDQVECLQKAFAALFILDLHYQNDWIYDEASRTNEDQFVIEKMPAAEWQTILKDRCIEDYFNLRICSLNVKERQIKEFQESFLYWMPANAKKEKVDDLKRILFKTKWVCSLFPDAFYDKYFGETEEYYFFAESGVYD